MMTEGCYSYKTHACLFKYILKFNSFTNITHLGFIYLNYTRRENNVFINEMIVQRSRRIDFMFKKRVYKFEKNY